MVDAIGFTSVSALMSSISYISSATATYFFSLAMYTPVILSKRIPTKIPTTSDSKGTKKSGLSCTNFFSSSFVIFLDSRVLESYRNYCSFFSALNHSL